MKYQVTILQKEEVENLENFLKEVTANCKSSIDKNFMKMEWRDVLIRYWNRDRGSENTILHDQIESVLKEHYPSLVEPKVLTRIFNAKESGFQTKARILWKDKIQKIDNIKEIISFCKKVV